MKKRQRREKPQFTTPPPQREDYSLEDILNEFGGWSRREPEPPPPAEPPAPPPEEPLPAESEAPPEEPAKARFQFVRLDVNREGEGPSPPEEPPVAPVPPVPKEAPAPEKPEKEPPRPRRPELREVHRSLLKREKGLTTRRWVSFALAVAAVALTMLSNFQVELWGFVFPTDLTAKLLLGLLFAGAITAWDVTVGGLYHLLSLHPGLDTLLSVCAVVFTVDGFLRLGGETRLPYVAVLLLGFWFSLWGKSLSNRARRRSIKLVMGLPDPPMSVILSRRAWGSRDCVFRGEGDRSGFAEDLDSPSLVDRAMAIYVPSVLGLSLVLALLMHFLRDRDFLMSWASMLAASLPLAGFVTFWRPFASLSARLVYSGAALCGWRGAKEMAESCCLAVTDTDLFPPGNVTLNGIKIFGDHRIDQVAGYVYAVIARSGSGLEPVFHEMYVNQNGRPCELDAFRRYDGGGLGADIQGEIILVGTITFMRAMGVHMDRGTNVRQAVYCAVNGELAAVFALTYTPTAAVDAALQTALRSKHLSLLLTTRDFVLAPDILKKIYHIPADSLEFPTAEERARLSGPYAALASTQTALLQRRSFLTLVDTVTGAQSLCMSVKAGLVVDLLGGIAGFLLAAFLVWTDGFVSLTAANLTLFCLLWSLPALLLTVSAGK